MALTNDKRTRRYQEAFDEFVQERRLDIEYPDTWSDADNQAWAAVVAQLRAEGVIR
ncbi:hypothetical protein GCM10022239_11790 [Leifsonia bigeumensis]|uniref:Acyl-CoA dehydrogenase n=1 Tax=Leifsonella bigeumensis TaxID=433643 RepID=A0ABP7FEE3_9MICO